MKLLEREAWGATAPLGPRLTSGIPGVYFHHSVTRPTGDPVADMRTLEAIGVDRFGIFSYCYVVFPDGTIGIGAGLTRGAHTAGLNSTRIGIVFVGDFTTDVPTPAALAAGAELLAHLGQIGALAHGYTVNGHRDQKATACPGDNLYPLLGAIHAAALHPPLEDDMTPEQARQLAEIHDELCTSRDDKGSKSSTVRWRITRLMEKAGIKPAK